MAAVNLEEIRKKYNFKNISVATWRDPRSSTIPARGGPSAPTFSAEAIAKPYIPTYKVKYKLPEPTDDEASEDEEKAAASTPPPKEESTEPGPEAPVDSLLEPPPQEATITDDVAAPSVAEGDPPTVLDGTSSAVADAGDDTQDNGNADGDIGVSTPISDPVADPLADLDDPLAGLVESVPPMATNGPLDDTAEDKPLDPGDDQENTQLPEHVEVPWPPTPPPMDQPATSPGIVFDAMPEPPANFFDFGDSLAVPALDPIDLAMIDPMQGMPGALDPPMLDAGPTPGSPDKTVHFAPGTPDPEPTTRKKKSVKGTKSKSKKRVEVPLASLPDDILAIVDGDMPDNTTLSNEPPATLDDTGIANESAINEAAVAVDTIKATPAVDEITEPAPEPVLEDTIPLQADAASPPAVQADEALPPAKKESTKASSKGKDKVKKKSLKSKSKKDKEPAAATGLGIDLAPPSEPAALLDLEDILKSFSPPPPLAEVETNGEDAVVASDAPLDPATCTPADGLQGADTAEDTGVSVQDVIAENVDIPEASQESEGGSNSPKPDVLSPGPIPSLDDMVVSNEEASITALTDESQLHEAEHARISGETEENIEQAVHVLGGVTRSDIDQDGDFLEPVEATADEDSIHVDHEAAAVWDDNEEHEIQMQNSNLDEYGSTDDSGLDEAPDVAAAADLRNTHEPPIEPEEDAASETQVEDIEAAQADLLDSAPADVVEESENDGKTPPSPMIVEQDDTNDEQLLEPILNIPDDAIEAAPAAETVNITAATEVHGLAPLAEAGEDGPSREVENGTKIANGADAVVNDDNSPGEPGTDSVVPTVQHGAGEQLDQIITEGEVDVPTASDVQETKAEAEEAASVPVKEDILRKVDEQIPDDTPAPETPVGADMTGNAEVPDQVMHALGDEERKEGPAVELNDKPSAAEESTLPPAEAAVTSSETVTKEVLADSPPTEPAPEPVAVDKQSDLIDPSPAAPPSPTLSKSSSHKQRADHWARKSVKRPSTSDSKESKSEKALTSKRSSKLSGDSSKNKDRDKSSRSSRRYSMSAEEEAERRKRRAARKAEEAARETARIEEKERERAHEEELRLIRHEARRAARKAAAEEAAKLVREEAEAIAREEAEARRRRREAREQESKSSRPKRERRESVNSTPLLFRINSSQPSQSRRSEGRPRSSRKDDRPTSRRDASPVGRREEPVVESVPEAAVAQAGPSSSNGSSSRRRRHASETDRPSTDRRDSGRRSQRPSAPEKTRSFLTSFLRSF